MKSAHTTQSAGKRHSITQFCSLGPPSDISSVYGIKSIISYSFDIVLIRLHHFSISFSFKNIINWMLKTKVHFLFSGIIITVATCRLAEIAPLDIRPSPPRMLIDSGQINTLWNPTAHKGGCRGMATQQTTKLVWAREEKASSNDFNNVFNCFCRNYSRLQYFWRHLTAYWRTLAIIVF